ncbi:DinB family protein [Paenibacillus sp. N1-5-1-14]|uniref:DinB family protein n=1 Tax=Paenibacillus radicibacter TaxID=2972488 RepID=UPI0021597C5E|nr:DinB family protein [Paenibacillus radicibacter]MCR8644356.1 DinB family protein [Paenibacillus radicibacter]
MKIWFEHNRRLREEWYEWCKDVPLEELVKKRTGGIGGILHTLFHIVDVEWSWLQGMQGKPDFQENFEEYMTLEKVMELDAKFRLDVEPFVQAWDDSYETRLFDVESPNGGEFIETWGVLMRHVIAHQIHHLGQISVWARGIDKKPVSPNLIRKGLMIPYETTK